MPSGLRGLADQFHKLAYCNTKEKTTHLCHKLGEVLKKPDNDLSTLQQMCPDLALKHEDTLFQLHFRWMLALRQKENSKVQEQLLWLYRWVFDHRGSFKYP